MVAKGDFTVEFPKTQKLQPKISHAEISGTEQPDQALVKTCIMFSQNDPVLKLKKVDSNVKWPPKFNLGLFKAYKGMFAVE